jgi:regulator of replication initiation timing
VHQSNCWDFNPVYEQARQRAEADHKRLDELASAIGDLVAQNTQLADENRRLAERLAVLEAAKPEKTKPRRGGEAE